MSSFTCPICGGKLNIKIGAEFAECDSCGKVTGIDPADAAKFRAVYQSAERFMRLDSVDGCRKAIDQLETIAFVDGAREMSEKCAGRLNELQAEKKERQATERTYEKRNAILGAVLIIVALLFCVAAVAGLVYMIVHIANGTFSPRILPIIICVTAVAVVMSVISKLK